MALKDNRFVRLWLILGAMAGFGAVVFFAVNYLNSNVICDLDCTRRNEGNLVLVILSLFGLFVGSLTYYFITEKYEKKITKMHKDASLTLRFFDGEERTIIKFLVDHGGSTTQSVLAKDTGLSRVRISRCLRKLGNKHIIARSPSGMTNAVEIRKELRELLVG